MLSVLEDVPVFEELEYAVHYLHSLKFLTLTAASDKQLLKCEFKNLESAIPMFTIKLHMQRTGK